MITTCVFELGCTNIELLISAGSLGSTGYLFVVVFLSDSVFCFLFFCLVDSPPAKCYVLFVSWPEIKYCISYRSSIGVNHLLPHLIFN